MKYYIEKSSLITVNVNQAVKCISFHTYEFYLLWVLEVALLNHIRTELQGEKGQEIIKSNPSVKAGTLQKVTQVGVQMGLE